jgi:hypothetical protein
MTDTTLVRTDAEQPYGLPFTYVATVGDVDAATSSAVTATLDVDAAPIDTWPVLSDAVTGLAATATITAWPDKSTDLGSTKMVVGARTVVISPPGASFEASVEFVTTTDTGRQNMLNLLSSATSKIILVRQGGPYVGVDGHYAFTAWVESRFTQRGSDLRRRWTLDLVESDGWAAALLASGSTLDDIEAVYAGDTLADLAGDFGTLLDMEVFDWAGQ